VTGAVRTLHLMLLLAIQRTLIAGTGRLARVLEHKALWSRSQLSFLPYRGYEREIERSPKCVMANLENQAQVCHSEWIRLSVCVLYDVFYHCSQREQVGLR
jgi:hypothetical protein